LYDSTSPFTYLRADTLVSLGFQSSIPTDTLVEIHGQTLTVHLARSHFENVDLLGQDFMVQMHGLLEIDFVKKISKLTTI
jgi:hypothetical protein